MDLSLITESCNARNAFYECESLKEIHIYNLKVDLQFSFSPTLSVEDNLDSTLGFMINHAANTLPITITLHHDAYVRVPQSLIDKATAKQISIADATPKTI